MSLGPYFPWGIYEKSRKINSNLKYPVFSNILLNSKTGKLLHIQNEFIVEARKEQLKIISNFYANYLKAENLLLKCNKIIPVPAKPTYSFNNVEIICHEFENIFRIPIDYRVIARSSDSEKSYEIINSSAQLNNAKVLLIDDIFTKGTTRDNIWSRLRNLGCKDLIFITIGKTDHNFYDYNM